MCNFKVGQKVVSLIDGVETDLIKGNIYTVTLIHICTCGRSALNVDYMLSRRLNNGYNNLKHVRNICFRPLVEDGFADEVESYIKSLPAEEHLVLVDDEQPEEMAVPKS